MYVTASSLNGRTRPSKKAPAEALWEEGDELRSTGKWSRNYEWVEVEGGEVSKVWCYYCYLTEELTPYIAVNEDYASVKIRSKPCKGKLRGYLKKGESIEITQVVLGWGKCDRGWIDLGYLKEEDLEP